MKTSTALVLISSTVVIILAVFVLMKDKSNSPTPIEHQIPAPEITHVGNKDVDIRTMNEKEVRDYKELWQPHFQDAIKELLKKREIAVAEDGNARLDLSETPVPARGDREAEKLYNEKRAKVHKTKEAIESIESIDQAIGNFEKLAHGNGK